MERNVLYSDREIPLTAIVADADARVAIDPDADATLEASIRSLGLLQPLVVCAHPNGRAQQYRLLAGHRRLRVLTQIHEDDPEAPTVPVRVMTGDVDAILGGEAALAENRARAAMHAADEALALQKLVEAGLTLSDIALRLALPERTVRRLLNLAQLDPRILQDYRVGACSDAVARALTTARHRKQGWKLYERLDAADRRNPTVPWDLKQSLMKGKYRGNDPMVKLVGIDKYRADGGAVVENLLSDQDDGELLLTDAPKLIKLAKRALERWVADTDTFGASVVVDPVTNTDALFPWDEWRHGSDPAQDDAPDALKGASVHVSVNYDGDPISAGPFWPKGKPKPDTDSGNLAGDIDNGSDGERVVQVEEKPKPRYSHALEHTLRSHWAGGVQRTVAAQWEQTWDLAIFMLSAAVAGHPDVWGEVVVRGGGWLSAIDVPDDPGLPFPTRIFDYRGPDLAEAYRKFREQPEAVKKQVAAQLAAQLMIPHLPGEQSLMDELGKDMDLADYWIPDVEFWNRVSKATIYAVLEEAGVPEERWPSPKLKKGEIAQAAEALAQEFRLVVPELRVAG